MEEAFQLLEIDSYILLLETLCQIGGVVVQDFRYTKMDKEKIEPAYSFGYGLSYTRFEISKCAVSENEDAYTVTATVKNTGERDGAEVVQVYTGSRGAADGEDRPVKLLKGFQRVELNAGEEKNVCITVPKEELKFWTPGGWVLDEAYSFYVGSDSRNVQPVV